MNMIPEVYRRSPENRQAQRVLRQRAFYVSAMTAKAAAEYLSINLNTVYNLMITRQLPAVKMKGVGWRVDRKKLDEAMEGEIEERGRSLQKLFGPAPAFSNRKSFRPRRRSVD
jgi:excisionase family DNA binding protein